MLPKRAIPRVTVAALTLGGTAACGSSSHSTVEEEARDFCERLADCDGSGPEYVETCLETYLPSGLMDACREAHRELFQCANQSFACGEPLPDECGDVAYEVYQMCDFAPGQAGEEAWCDQLASCYGHTQGEYLGCVYDYQDYVLSYYDSFCRGVLRDMWLCLGRSVSCEQIAGRDYSDCRPEIDETYAECGYDFYE